MPKTVGDVMQSALVGLGEWAENSTNPEVLQMAEQATVEAIRELEVEERWLAEEYTSAVTVEIGQTGINLPANVVPDSVRMVFTDSDGRRYPVIRREPTFPLNAGESAFPEEFYFSNSLGIATVTVDQPGAGQTELATITTEAPDIGMGGIVDISIVGGVVTGGSVQHPGWGYVEAPTVTVHTDGQTDATLTTTLKPVLVAFLRALSDSIGYMTVRYQVELPELATQTDEIPVDFYAAVKAARIRLAAILAPSRLPAETAGLAKYMSKLRTRHGQFPRVIHLPGRKRY
jgi:hypothetical protein